MHDFTVPRRDPARLNAVLALARRQLGDAMQEVGLTPEKGWTIEVIEDVAIGGELQGYSVIPHHERLAPSAASLRVHIALET